jgi:hypothetical protein
MSRSIYSLLFTVFFLQAAAGAAPTALRKTVLAELDGAAVVTEGDVADWQRLQACYGEEALISRRAAFMRLLEAAIAEKALRGAGAFSFSRKDLDAEAARIDGSTRAPEILECIKKNLGPGEERYLRTFVRTALIESSLRNYLRAGAGAQAGRLKLAEEALAKVRAGAGMEETAKEYGFTHSTAAYSVVDSSAAAMSDPIASVRLPFEKDFIERNLKDLKPGELKTKLIDSDNSFSMVRLLAAEGNKWTFESAFLPKLGQKEWLQTLPKMKLTVLDAELRGWVKSINGNPRLAVVDLK